MCAIVALHLYGFDVVSYHLLSVLSTPQIWNVNSVTRQREREGDIDVSHLVIANKTSLFIFSSSYREIVRRHAYEVMDRLKTLSKVHLCVKIGGFPC